ncbi:MAG: signal recognition particle protein [Puniceicoccales bacterium]|jgi:signal recognition particle subunit SRP54|nr:signal recognition particle protein [Puniceicoccales bacterium]
MFENLTDRMSDALRKLRGIDKISEKNIGEALLSVKEALLTSDVNFKVVTNFLERVRTESIGHEVTRGVMPGQQIIKIIYDELITTLGKTTSQLSCQKPLIIMLAGLHGSGKTTTSVKLARLLKKSGHKPVVIGCDVYRPAANDQLETLANSEEIACHIDRSSKNAVTIAKAGLQWANDLGHDAIIFDTAGRLQIDTDLIEEIRHIKKAINPNEILLVADGAIGQEAVDIAKHFNDALDLTGIILTKLDGDTHGGAALSMTSITNLPIKFIGVGEKMDALDIFHPERIAQRILGMGDIVSLVEKAEEHIDDQEVKKLEEKLKKSKFDLDDFLSQIRNIKKMGSLESLINNLPGAHKLDHVDGANEKLKITESIILSMTKAERKNPKILDGSRRKRIANGSGRTVQDVNILLKQFTKMQDMMKKFKNTSGRSKFRSMFG